MPTKRYRVITRDGQGEPGFLRWTAGGKVIIARFGEVVSNIPAESVPWLLQDAHIEEVTPDGL